MFDFLKKPILVQAAKALTKAIDKMSVNHKETEGKPVTIIAFKKRSMINGELVKKPEVRFCVQDEEGTFRSYRTYDEEYVNNSASGSELMMINQLSPKIMELIDAYEEENGNIPIQFHIYNEDVDGKRRTFLRLVGDGKLIHKMEFLEILNRA